MFRLVCDGRVHHYGFAQLTLEPCSGVEVVVGVEARFLSWDVPACTRSERRFFFLLSPRTMVAESGVRARIVGGCAGVGRREEERWAAEK